MSYIPPQQLAGPNLIVQYVIEYRGRGHFLPYDDHQIIEEWLTLSESPETLLLLLSDIIPEFYSKHRSSSHPPSLKRLNKRVLNLLKARVSRTME